MYLYEVKRERRNSECYILDSNMQPRVMYTHTLPVELHVPTES